MTSCSVPNVSSAALRLAWYSIDAGTTAEYTEHHDLIAMLAALKCMCNTRDQSGLGTLSML
jgi:hypothetical protein